MTNNNLKLYKQQELEQIFPQIQQAFQKVKRASYWGEKFQKITELKSWEDFFDLPVTSPQELRQAPLASRTAAPPEDIEIILSSSGLKNGILCGYSARDHRFADYKTETSIAIGMPTNGVVLNLLPSGWLAGAEMLINHLMELGMTVISPPPPLLTQILPKIMAEMRISMVLSLPTKIPLLLQGLMAAPVPVAKLGIRNLMLAGEPASLALIDNLSRAFGDAEVFNYYGTCEAGGIGYGRRQTFFPYPGVFVEIDSEGQLIVTNLIREGCPVFRYQTGDLAIAPVSDSQTPDKPAFILRGRARDRLFNDVFALDIEEFLVSTAGRFVDHFLIPDSDSPETFTLKLASAGDELVAITEAIANHPEFDNRITAKAGTPDQFIPFPGKYQRIRPGK